MKLICIAGLPGAGKSTVADIFVENGFSYIRFGQAVIDEVIKRGLEINEKNERLVREDLRKIHGMDVMAKINVPKIKKLIKNQNIVADGLYSFAEYKLLKKVFNNKLIVIAVQAPPEVRYTRLTKRESDNTDVNIRFRKLSRQEAIERDYAEIEKLDKAGPIAMADWTIINIGTKDELKLSTNKLIDKLLKNDDFLKVYI